MAAVERWEDEETDIITYVRAAHGSKALEHMPDRRDVREEMLPLPHHPMTGIPVDSDRPTSDHKSRGCGWHELRNQSTTPASVG
jgi:hypothetical protein